MKYLVQEYGFFGPFYIGLKADRGDSMKNLFEWERPMGRLQQKQGQVIDKSGNRQIEKHASGKYTQKDEKYSQSQVQVNDEETTNTNVFD